MRWSVPTRAGGSRARSTGPWDRAGPLWTQPHVLLPGAASPDCQLRVWASVHFGSNSFLFSLLVFLLLGKSGSGSCTCEDKTDFSYNELRDTPIIFSGLT